MRLPSKARPVNRRAKTTIRCSGGPFSGQVIPRPACSTLTFSVAGFKGYYNNTGNWVNTMRGEI